MRDQNEERLVFLFIYFGEYRDQSTATTLSLLGYEDPLSHSEGCGNTPFEVNFLFHIHTV
jgi:hypothetical protein